MTYSNESTFTICIHCIQSVAILEQWLMQILIEAIRNRQWFIMRAMFNRIAIFKSARCIH